MRPPGAAAHAGADITHRCFVYDDEKQFRDLAGRFLLEGLERGERLLCVGPLAVAASGPDVVPDSADLIAGGGLTVVDLGEVYTGDITDRLRFYRDMTERALAEGYAGLRVLADVASVQDVHHQVRWEHQADAYMASGSGMSALCAYPRASLSPGSLRDLAAMHPESVGDPEPPTFRLFFQDHRLMVTGDVDAFGSHQFQRLLSASHLGDDGVTVDLTELRFIDGHASVVLERWLRELARSTPVNLVGASPTFRRLWDILGFSNWFTPTLDEVTT